MFEEPDPFSSQRVEESIEQLSTNDLPPDVSGEQERPDPNARLIHDMQALYAFESKRYLRALQRVEDRLVEQYVTNGERPAPLPVLPGQQTRAPHTIQQGRVYSMEQKKSRMSTFGRRVSLLVAVLVMGVLVGSLVLVMNAAHQKTAQSPNHNNTQVGAGQTAQTPASTFGKTVYTMPSSSSGFQELAWSPDSTRVASLADGVTIWDATTGKHLVNVALPAGAFTFYALAWSPNSQLVAVGANNTLILVNGQTGAVVKTYPVGTSADILPPVGGGSYLSARMPASGGLGVRGLAWSHDGNFLAVAISGGATGGIKVINPQNGAVDYTLPVTGNYVPGVLSWSADGKYVAAGVFNTEPGNTTVPQDQQMMVWAWNTATKQVVFQHSGGNNNDSVAWSPNSDTLAFGAPGTQQNETTLYLLTFWNAATNQVTSYQASAFGPIAWSPDGKYIVFVGTTHLTNSIVPSAPLASVIDTSTGKLVYEYKQHNANIATLAWSPDGKYIVSGEEGGSGSFPTPTPSGSGGQGQSSGLTPTPNGGPTPTSAVVKVWTAE